MLILIRTKQSNEKDIRDELFGALDATPPPLMCIITASSVLMPKKMQNQTCAKELIIVI